MDSTTKIVMAAIGHTWVISHPAFKDKAIHQVLYTEEDEMRAIDRLMIDGAARCPLGVEITSPGIGGPETHKIGVEIPSPGLQCPPQECHVQTRSQRKSTPLVALPSKTRSRSSSSSNDKEQPTRKSPRRSNERQCKTRHRQLIDVYGKGPKVAPLEQWVGKQPEPQPRDKLLLTDTPDGYPKGLKFYRDEENRRRIAVPETERVPLTQQEHISLLHVAHKRVLHMLMLRYWWPDMNQLVKGVCGACRQCQRANVRRRHLSAAFSPLTNVNHAKLLPRQEYGIDFYGHHDGNILVAIDLCTREVKLWFLRKQTETLTAKALLTGLILQQGVPLLLRSDAANQLIAGTVQAMNKFLGIRQIHTGGYNPRGNAIAERFMQTLNAMLRKCDDKTYKNIEVFLPAIAFAHNTTYNSTLQCTPFECGHGYRARTISDARLAPRLQLNLEGDSQVEDVVTRWESSVPKKVLELAMRFSDEARKKSEWHRKMPSNRLNQAGRSIGPDLQPGARVYFYKPPTQSEIEKRGRMAKHLDHYLGPATVVRKSGTRSYQLEYRDPKRANAPKPFSRDISMIIPEKAFLTLPTPTPDFAVVASPPPSKHNVIKPLALREGEMIICLDHDNWYLAEVNAVYPDKARVRYYSTPTPPLDSYGDTLIPERVKRLQQVRFRKTWFFRDGPNAGKGTVSPPFPDNPDLRVWDGDIPASAYSKELLIRNVRLSGEGSLDSASVQLAANTYHIRTPHIPPWKMSVTMARRLTSLSVKEI